MSDLTDRIRAKYPDAYKDMDDATLEKQVLAKHPEYKDLASTAPQQVQTKPVQQPQLTNVPSDKPYVGQNVIQMGRQSLASQQHEAQHEPDTWWGGFMKSIADQIIGATAGNPSLQSVAHPSTTADFLNQVLPAQIPNVSTAVRGMFGGEGNVAKVAESAITETPFPTHAVDDAGRDLGAFDLPQPERAIAAKANPGNARPVFKDPNELAYEVAAQNKNMGLPQPESGQELAVKPKVRLNSDGTYTDLDTGEVLNSSGKPVEPEIFNEKIPENEYERTQQWFKDDSARMERERIARESDPVWQAAQKAKNDDWNNIQRHISVYEGNFNEPNTREYTLKDTSNYTPEQLAVKESYDKIKALEDERSIKFSQEENKLPEDQFYKEPQHVKDYYDKEIARLKAEHEANIAKLQDRPDLETNTIDVTPTKVEDAPKFDASKIVYPSSEARQPNMLSSVDNPDIPPPEFSSGGGSGNTPEKPPTQPKLIEDPENWKPEEKNLLQGFYDITKGLKSVDFPGLTSAAFRQGGKLQGTKAWFKAWIPAAKAFGSENLFNAMQESIKSHPIYQYAKASGLEFTDLANFREEQIRTDLAEKIPGVGRYIRASNRAYTTFLNQLRLGTFDKFTKLAQAERETQSLWNKSSFGLLGESPKITNIKSDIATGRQLADAVNTLTGRGRLSVELGKKTYEAEKSAKLLNATLWSPRSVASNIRMLNPNTYMFANPLVRRQYMAGMLRQVSGWWGLAELAKFSSPHVSVSTDPTNADFGKIKIGNTRIDPPGGLQQYLVLLSREAMGGSTSSTTNKFTPFGKGFKPSTPTSAVGDFASQRIHPTLQFAGNVANALMSVKKKGDPSNTEMITDQALQAVLPMYVADIASVIEEDPSLAPWLAPTAGVASSIGMGMNSYKPKENINKPVFTPLTGFDFGSPSRR